MRGSIGGRLSSGQPDTRSEEKVPAMDRPRTGEEDALLPPAVQLRQLIFGHVVSQIVSTVARLGVADELRGGRRSSAELAARCGAEPDAFRRFLRACAGLGLFEEVEDGVFGLGPLGEWLGSDGPSLRDLAVALTGPGHWRSIERLCDAVVSGRATPADALGMGIWEYYRHNPEEGQVFAAAMGAISAVVVEDLVAHYDVTGYERIVDVGGSHGVLLAGLLQANPRARGVLLDLPEVVDGAHEALAERGLAGRVEVVAGDFREEVPPDGDLYVLKHILHDWDDEQAARILRSCHRAGRPGSTLLVIERLLGPGADPLAHVADLLMLVMFAGRERTREEFEALLDAGGYRLERVVRLPMFSVLEARRR
jgi:predicted O-methyltransferase YrrM